MSERDESWESLANAAEAEVERLKRPMTALRAVERQRNALLRAGADLAASVEQHEGAIANPRLDAWRAAVAAGRGA